MFSLDDRRGTVTPALAAFCLSLATLARAEPLDFARDVLPILSDNCFHCHGPDEANRQADLRLDLETGFARGGERSVVVPGRSDQSELFRRVASGDPGEAMPPPESQRRLTAGQIETLRRWIDEGARWGRHWSLAPPVRPTPPVVKQADWPGNPIDRFILARLEAERLTHSAEASRETLIRRVSLDLTGLPPTLAEIDAFVADRRPDAYERLVDRLLASPRYGERMAWDWLDAARYADTNGYQGDVTRTMWPWRDWVVGALNSNMPFDQFTVEQLAGDLLSGASFQTRLATAFQRNHMINSEGGRIAEESRVEYVVDRTDTMGTVWLGLTLGCARCHDHKYDPLTTRDYYGLYAYFNNLDENATLRSGQQAPTLEAPTPEQARQRRRLRDKLSGLQAQLAALDQKLLAKQRSWELAGGAEQLPAEIAALAPIPPEARSEDQRRQIAAAYLAHDADRVALAREVERAKGELAALEKAIPKVMIMEDQPQPRQAFILLRGAYDKYGEPVRPGTPAALPGLPPEAPLNRLGLARWLVEPGHPLVARVTANRAWQAFFGTGLVKTVEDLGVQGERPSHPELLDWLACELVDSGWNMKHLHRLIVTSSTYRQSSRATARLLASDPENRLLARGARFRLPSHMLRDQALAIGGLLVEQLGGEPVRPYQPAGVWEEATFGKIGYEQDHGSALYRRSLYVFWRRIIGPTMFFDAAARQVCTVRQSRTNSPLHALTLLNDVTHVEAARALAQRVLQIAGPSDRERIALAFRLATARRPSDAEAAILAERVAILKAGYAADREAVLGLLAMGESRRDERLDASEHAAYTALCQLILNLDEVLNRE